MIRILALALGAGLGACAPRTAGSSNQSRTPADTAHANAVALERTPCFGGCPVYTVAVSPSGEVTYQGRANVRQLDTATAQISGKEVEALLEELSSAGFFSFADRYIPSEQVCGRYVTDSPSAITTVSHRGRTKTIVHDYGCGGAPGALVVLERRIDEALGSDRWTGR